MLILCPGGTLRTQGQADPPHPYSSVTCVANNPTLSVLVMEPWDLHSPSSSTATVNSISGRSEKHNTSKAIENKKALQRDRQRQQIKSCLEGYPWSPTGPVQGVSQIGIGGNPWTRPRQDHTDPSSQLTDKLKTLPSRTLRMRVVILETALQLTRNDDKCKVKFVRTWL